MKKTFTCIAMFACIGFFTSCSKDVKAPEKPRSTNSTTTSSTAQSAGQQTQQHNQGNGCYGSNSGSYNNGSGGGY